MIKVVIFDLDDTLISEKSFALSAFGEISIELSKVIKKPTSAIYEELVSLYNESANYIFNRILEKNNIHLNKNFIEDLIYIYRNHKPNIKLSDEVVKLLLHLKKAGFHLGLITDGFKSTQRNKVISLELDKYIEIIVITDELGDNREFWKPSEKPYTVIKDYFNVEYNEMIYIGDNINKDFIAPIKLGMESILYSNKNSIYHEESKKSTGIYTVTKIIDILDFITNRDNELE